MRDTRPVSYVSQQEQKIWDDRPKSKNENKIKDPNLKIALMFLIQKKKRKKIYSISKII